MTSEYIKSNAADNISCKTLSATSPLRPTLVAHRLKNYCFKHRLFQPQRALTHFCGIVTRRHFVKGYHALTFSYGGNILIFLIAIVGG